MERESKNHIRITTKRALKVAGAVVTRSVQLLRVVFIVLPLEAYDAYRKKKQREK